MLHCHLSPDSPDRQYIITTSVSKLWARLRHLAVHKVKTSVLGLRMGPVSHFNILGLGISSNDRDINNEVHNTEEYMIR
jgi:hypothetical protein